MNKTKKLKPVEESIEDWINYYINKYFDSVETELPESLLSNIPNLLIEDGYTNKQINNAKGYCFYIKE